MALLSDTKSQYWKSPFFAANISWGYKAIGTSTVFSETVALVCGDTASQLLLFLCPWLLMSMEKGSKNENR
jgi:hypothetical protein